MANVSPFVGQKQYYYDTKHNYYDIKYEADKMLVKNKNQKPTKSMSEWTQVF